MDRFDLRIEVPPVAFSDLDLPASGETSATVAQRVAAARSIQSARYAQHPAARTNADAEGRDLLLKAADRFGLTARSYYRIPRVARTIADLAGEPRVGRVYVAEAVSFRLTTLRA